MAQVRKYVYLDSDHDADILEWLSKQPRQSAAIKAALCAWVRDAAPDNAAPLDLAAIRQVVDAAIAAAGLSLSPSAPQDNGDEVDECEAILDELASNALM